VNDVVQVQFTIDDREAAGTIVNSLLADHLVACGQVGGPVSSVYRWRGGLEKATEWTVVLKTRAGLIDAVVERVEELHPYETPEVLAVPVLGGSQAYIDWIVAETTRG